jgi:hypothetical protein
LATVNAIDFDFAGISFKTQLLYAIVFCTRYVDLLTSFVSLYNSVMKVFFIASSLYIVFLIKFKFRATHDPSIDTFKIEFLLGGAAVLGLLFPYKYTVIEVGYRAILLNYIRTRNVDPIMLDSLGILRVVGGCGYPTSALYAPTYW